MFNDLNFQNANSPLIEEFILFHDWVIVFVVRITLGVVFSLYLITRGNKFTHRFLIESQNVEFLWTVLPCLVLVAIGMPSLRLLYMIDEVRIPALTLKAIGNQWYWSYEYTDFNDIEFDSYILKESRGRRLLEVDHRIVLPFKNTIRVLVTAADVLHSWTIPVLGVKADAIPGRLNILILFIDRPGIFYGQCREICGRNHSFMPISLEVTNSSSFMKWIKSIAKVD